MKKLIILITMSLFFINCSNKSTLKYDSERIEETHIETNIQYDKVYTENEILNNRLREANFTNSSRLVLDLNQIKLDKADEYLIRQNYAMATRYLTQIISGYINSPHPEAYLNNIYHYSVMVEALRKRMNIYFAASNIVMAENDMKLMNKIISVYGSYDLVKLGVTDSRKVLRPLYLEMSQYNTYVQDVHSLEIRKERLKQQKEMNDKYFR